VPDLFEAVIGNEQLWDVNPLTPPAGRCKLDSYRLGELFKHIMNLRAASERPGMPAEQREKREAAVRCFAALTKALVSLNAVHLLEVAIRPESQAGPVDCVLLRRFQADEGMRFPFLASNAVPLDVLFSNALWSAYTIVYGLVRDDAGADAAPAPASVDPAAVPTADGAAALAPVPLAAQIMTLFGKSIANPVVSVDRFKSALSQLVQKVNRAAAFATTVLSQLGEHSPAGSTKDGLVPVEKWVVETIIPTLAALTERVVSLYPRVGAADEEFILQSVEKSVASKPAVRES
jgi:hypothetical protein